jgi:hypothetical protein
MNIIKLPITRNGFAELLGKFGFTEGVEIGTDQGIYAEILLKSNPRLHLTCIDPWKSYSDYKDIQSQKELDKNYETTKQRLKKYDMEIIRTTSMEAVKGFKDESLDFIYIDGNHEFNYVVEDLENWQKKVKKGGIISGHDYKLKGNKYGYQDVTDAVTRFFVDYPVNNLYLTVGMHQSTYFFFNE